MEFPADIKGAMKECILKLLWAKDDIVSFFSTNGCTKKEISSLKNYKELNRSQIIDNMYKQLSSRNDHGLGQFRAMLSALINWTHFNSYYFDKLKKLSRDEAKRSIEHLRQIQEIRDHKIKKQRKKQFQKNKSCRSPKKTLEELKNQYISLLQGSMLPQQRGYELEKILLELSKLSSLETTEGFRVNGEQIDGAIKYDGEHYILEAKWHDKESANEPVYQFVAKIEGKMYGRGLFISINGFSNNVVNSLVHGKALRTLFIDGEDLIFVLEGLMTFSEMLDKKIKAAQTKGLIYVNPYTGVSKL